MLEQQLRAWLATEPDAPPDTIAAATSRRVRVTRQLPGWAARLRRGRGGGPVRALQLGGAVASVAVAAVVVALLGQSVTGPAQQTAGPPASSDPSGAPGGSPSASPAGTPTASSTPFDGRAVPALRLDQRATGLGSGFGSLWLGDAAGQLLRIDPSDMQVIATIELGAIACGPIVAAAGSMWLATCGDGPATDVAVTVRVDPTTNAIADRYADGGGDGAGASALNGLVWFVSDVQQGRLTGVDAVTGQPVRELAVGTPVRHLAAGFGSLWVSALGRPAVLRLDPETGAQQAAVALSGDPAYLITAGDSIWVSEPHQWLVGRIDPVADRVAAEIGASPGVDHLVIGESGVVWSLADAEAMAVDPGTNLTIDRFSVPPHVALDGIATDVLAVIGDTLWYADGLVLLRIAAS